jgi:UDP-N-acetylmuramyl pentapeptide phosphotransferase/UDP-N-acetylglucosamine-1-phosphate transferase
MLIEVMWAGAFGLVSSLGLVAAAREWARRRSLVDHPNDRSLHVHPTPRGGGIGVVVPVSIAIAASGMLAPDTQAKATCLAGAALLIAAVGLFDDIRGLPPVTRLFAHLSAAVLLVLAAGPWRFFVWPGLWSFDLGGAAIPLSVLLLVGLTNVYNFMDGADGMAGAQSFVAGLGWIGVAYVVRDPQIGIVGAVIATASLGFLFFNWSPASVFMGDVGSAFLGFVLATLSILVAPRSPATATAGMLFVWPFLFDTSFTLILRASRRENLLCAHRTHLYQRLVLTGLPHRRVALLYAALSGVGVAVGNVVAREAAVPSILGGALIVGLASGLWLLVIRREKNEIALPGAPAPES